MNAAAHSLKNHQESQESMASGLVQQPKPMQVPMCSLYMRL